MIDFEIEKCIKLSRKWPDIDPGNIIKCIRSEYGINEDPKTEKTGRLELVIKTVCNYLNEAIEDLLTPKGNGSGRGELVRIRQIVSLIAYEDYNYSYAKIGEYLIRDHVSIMISKKKAWNFYDINKQFRADVDICRNLVEKTILLEIYTKNRNTQ